jgi:sarcosine oxidase/L-pipecolate oxidase
VGKEAMVEKLPHLAAADIEVRIDDLVLIRADVQDWRGLWVKQGGWVAARNALDSVGHELRRLGVKTAFGTAGTFKAPLLSSDANRCVGVLAEDGTEWAADVVVMATGAWSPTLVDLEGQCISKVS